MRARIARVTILVAGFALLLFLAFASSESDAVSTHSTFDAGPNGYEALYNVLAREGVHVGRLTGPFELRDRSARVLAFVVGENAYDAGDITRLQGFQHQGGRLVFFGTPTNAMLKELRKAKLNVRQLDVAGFTNSALSRNPSNALAAYDALAHRGLVLFDERLQGYDETRSFWSVLPSAVRIAFGLAALAVVLVLVDANVRFAPPIVREPPAERDSSAYLVSMASLLRRARAGRAALARFAALAPDEPELQAIAKIAHPSDALLVHAATLFQQRRKAG